MNQRASSPFSRTKNCLFAISQLSNLSRSYILHCNSGLMHCTRAYLDDGGWGIGGICSWNRGWCSRIGNCSYRVPVACILSLNENSWSFYTLGLTSTLHEYARVLNGYEGGHVQLSWASPVIVAIFSYSYNYRSTEAEKQYYIHSNLLLQQWSVGQFWLRNDALQDSLGTENLYGVEHCSYKRLFQW